MRKFVQILIMVCMVVFSAQVAFAHSDKVTVQEGADLASVHRLAIGMPEYVPVGETAPTKDDVLHAVADASKVARCYVVSYDAAAEGIKSDKGVDIKSLDRRKAATEFKNDVSAYADAYVILTVANNSSLVLFYDVYKAGTNELLYSYQIAANRSDKDEVDTYKMLSEQFFKNFERSAEDQQKKSEKEAKKKK